MNERQIGIEKKINKIRTELKNNINNSSLYCKMADIYKSAGDFNRSYLCYEKALYLCKDKNKDAIQESMNELKNKKADVRNVSFIILTYNQLEYTKVCIESIRKNCNPETYEIIVVDNNSADGTVEWLKCQSDIKTIYNNENKGFPKGCNHGIKIADKNNDIMLLNNDTVIMTNSIFNMRMGLYSKSSVGACGAVSNRVSNYQMISEKFDDFNQYLNFALRNNITDQSSYEERTRLIGFAMLLKRDVLEKTGYLDERFTPGNFEDDDISLRIGLNGNKLLLCKDSYIHHFGSVSFKSVKGGLNNLLLTNSRKFKEKWNCKPYEFQKCYISVSKYISKEDKNILQINSGGSAALVSIRNNFADKEYYSYNDCEILNRLNQNLNINVIDSLDDDKYSGYFDVVIVDEYSKNVLFKAEKMLKDNGKIITVMDAYKENKLCFTDNEIKESINRFSKYFSLNKFEPEIINNQITKCIMILESKKSTSIREREDIYTSVKFLLRRVDIKKDTDVLEVFDIIDNNNLSDKCVIDIVKRNIINKIFVFNFIAIEYFTRGQYERVLPYLTEALCIDDQDKDTAYNIAYVLNYFGEKEKALEYLENITEKNHDIEKLIMEIR